MLPILPPPAAGSDLVELGLVAAEAEAVGLGEDLGGR